MTPTVFDVSILNSPLSAAASEKLRKLDGESATEIASQIETLLRKTSRLQWIVYLASCVIVGGIGVLLLTVLHWSTEVFLMVEIGLWIVVGAVFPLATRSAPGFAHCMHALSSMESPAALASQLRIIAFYAGDLKILCQPPCQALVARVSSTLEEKAQSMSMDEEEPLRRIIANVRYFRAPTTELQRFYLAVARHAKKTGNEAIMELASKLPGNSDPQLR